MPAHRAGHLTSPTPGGHAGSRPQPREARWRAAPVCVSDMSDSPGGGSPLCNLMEVKH